MTTELYDVLGVRAKRRVAILTVVAVVIGVAILAYVFVVLSERGQLDPKVWQVLVRGDFAMLLLHGLGGTLKVALVAMGFSIIAGLLLAVAQLYGGVIIRNAARVVIEVFRGLPLLLIIFMVYLGLPALGMNIPTFWALALGLTLFGGAVIGEVFRGGVLAVGSGQREAGLTVGLGGWQVLIYILTPQAIRIVLPTLVSQLVTLLKGSSLGFVIGYTELLRNGQTAIEYLGGVYSLPIFTMVALIYIVVNIAVSELANRLTRSTRRRSIGKAV